MTAQQAATRFLGWLDQQVLNAGRGDALDELSVEPKGRFWLGRLASEEAVIASALGERGERLDPCAIGLRVIPSQEGPWAFVVEVLACVWIRGANGGWRKCPKIREQISISVADMEGNYDFGQVQLKAALEFSCGHSGLTCGIRVEVRRDLASRKELTILMVNNSPKDLPTLKDTTLYECALEVTGLPTQPFILESLPDSFRYDRRIPAYGVNCGVQRTVDGLRTTDTVSVERSRPRYWCVTDPSPNMTFARLAADPMPSLIQLIEAHTKWGRETWATAALDDRSHACAWSSEMRVQADLAASEFSEENKRLGEGLTLLKTVPKLLQAFKGMNQAMLYASNGKYTGWRPFQIGFILANIRCIASSDNDSRIADVVWFATGGGKTETYLGLLITAALFDRLRGKMAGITAWSRFPLRMLSLQQTQRFADAMAGAERVRREGAISGDPFSVGFLVGQGATPNAISEDPQAGEPDPEDDKMPDRYRVLLKCPFCHENSIAMAFDRRYWRLVHQCSAATCPWPEPYLPFYVVDDEIYRFLPTVVVGTLDKAASIAVQTGMRCLVGFPTGMCSEEGHGYIYAPRSKRPNGCLVPGCQGRPIGLLSNQEELYAPTFRLQDELHLLKDSLGAVDSHYESLLDHLSWEISGRKPKILASSATLTGYERQIELLYGRTARVFPVQGPSPEEGFWTSTSDDLARRYVAVAPRGATIEYAVDRTVTELQTAVRRLRTEADLVCTEAGISAEWADQLLSLYGVDVVYGNNLRDLDAVARSLQTQVNVNGALNTASLTGRTDFEDVRATLDRLEKPESLFDDRLHVITASSMMSHGVDIDRLNVMVMLGVPLTASEFIQATARAGRRWPGLVYIMHKMARERDASVFRSFAQFVRQGDRFVEPIPITRRSRRVLEKTLSGLVLARIMSIHEVRSQQALTTVNKLRAYFVKTGVTEQEEVQAVIQMLGFNTNLDEGLRNDVQKWFRRFFENLMDPGGTFKFPSELCPTGKPMRSLRDVEEEAPIIGV